MLYTLKITIVFYVVVAWEIPSRVRQSFDQPFRFDSVGTLQNNQQVGSVNFGSSVGEQSNNNRYSNDFNPSNQYSPTSIRFPTNNGFLNSYQSVPSFTANNPTSILLKPGSFNEVSRNNFNPDMMNREDDGLVDIENDSTDPTEDVQELSNRFLFHARTRCPSGYRLYKNKCYRIVKVD
jgi:hypothetical protein